ncbi:NAD(P)-dependent oxidoreductase [Kibdelosporangium persicum]|uniref:Beta-hydroxyacid dehydrogenase, 3-hydroxyisobutyrate dehydrogenase n=1 Tax=Kibdelosporangium persicum TaxID=2698649 RepID=A0ABX2FHX7_9PSEU|nr:NAD(P)-dependent oxidoreductase [Kibdelosporangium persicum]NRN71021.1 Beta-hydroxyacid dehydrogenase, 3-hydroxyisobutyrate dehydrogenase [Kibdelosporangium persicum]
MPETPTAVIGLGAMGSGMARSLLAAGFTTIVFNRTATKAESLRQAGAIVAATAANAAAVADVVLLSLADEEAVERVLFGELAGRLRPGMVVVDTSTVSPAFSREAARRLAEAGVRRVEACVIGNPMMAATGQLRVFTAGNESDVDSVHDVLVAIGREHRHLGPAGNACVLKLAFNLLLGVQTVGLAEAVAFVEAMGMDRRLLLDAFAGSGWHSPVLGFRAEFMRTRNYQPAAFRAALMLKDLSLAGREAHAQGVELPIVGRATEILASTVDAGYGDDDAAAVVELPLRTNRADAPAGSA